MSRTLLNVQRAFASRLDAAQAGETTKDLGGNRKPSKKRSDALIRRMGHGLI